MSAILVQLGTGRHNLVPSLLRMRPCLISARISNRNFATASCSRTFLQSTHPRWTVTSPFATLRRRPIFTSAPLSLRYHPPRNSYKARGFLSFLDNIPQDLIFYGIIGINSAVFMMWYMAVQKFKQQGDPSTVLWMRENFLSSWNNLVSGRLWTPLTSCFSHQDLSHILFNGFTFFFMAQPMLQMLGSRQFIFLYLGGGLISSFSSIAYAKLSGKRDYASHGASGAIYSIVSLFACVAPTTKFQLYGIIPVPAWLVVTGLFSYDLYSTLSHKSGTTDTVGHVSGILAGVAYFILKRFRVL